MYRLQMLCMHQKPSKFITVHFQTKQNSQSYIIDAALHGTVHGFCMICIVVLWSRRMEFFIAFFMIRFLKQNVGSDSCILQFTVVLHRGGCNIHIDTTDSPIFMFDAVNGFDTFQNIFNRIIHRILTSFNSKTFMSHVLESCHFLYNFFLGQFPSGNMLIFHMVRAVHTTIDTIVGQIKRCKKYDSISIEIFLNLLCQRINLRNLLRHFTCQKYRCFPVV